MTHSPVTCSKEALRAAAKLLTHGNSTIFAPNSRAMSRVRSVEPVSAMTISSNRSLALRRQSGRFFSSFLTIMLKVLRGRTRMTADSELARFNIGASAARDEVSSAESRCPFGPDGLSLTSR